MEIIILLLFLMGMEGSVYLFLKCEGRGGKLEYFHQLSTGGISVIFHLESDLYKTITSAL